MCTRCGRQGEFLLKGDIGQAPTPSLKRTSYLNKVNPRINKQEFSGLKGRAGCHIGWLANYRKYVCDLLGVLYHRNERDRIGLITRCDLGHLITMDTGHWTNRLIKARALN